jgi:RimJ/RimL family protein N-acetyltransferase
LLADEARHNLLFGLASTLLRHPARYPAWHLWLVRDGDRVVGASLHTPPFNVIVAEPTDPAAPAILARSIYEAGVRPPGVVACHPEGGRFADAWCAIAGGTARTTMAQGVYALEHVREVPTASGRARPAELDDRPLLLDWVRAFSTETLSHRPLTDEQVAATVDQRLGEDDEGFAIWEDGGEPVSMTGYGGPTPNGIRIGPVYTPPALRGRGYATSLVARVSAERLASGRRFCFLYTDLANPTSNAIYRRIGYEQVCESAEIVFDA